MARELTEWQAEVLAHRLEVPDALADVVEDDGLPVTYEQVYEACERMLSAVRQHRMPETTSDLERLLLADCIEGSTYLAAVGHSVSGRTAQAFEALALRVAALLGKRLRLPAPLEGSVGREVRS